MSTLDWTNTVCSIAWVASNWALVAPLASYCSHDGGWVAAAGAAAQSNAATAAGAAKR